MPQKAWSAKREHQYVHIKESLLHRGEDKPLAEEIAARVVNKERAQHRESVEANSSSINDMSSGRRGGAVHAQGASRPNLAATSQRGPPARAERALHDEQGAA